MNLDTFILYLAIHILLTFLVVYFTAKWTEAGKQAAIIERIEELTKKIKTVETELHLQAAAKQSLHELAKESALQTFESLSLWNSFLNYEMLKFKDYNINEDQFDSSNEMAERKFERFIASMSKTEIYLQKTPVINAFTDCMDSLKQLQHLNFRSLYNMLYYYPNVKNQKEKLAQAINTGNSNEAKRLEELIKKIEEEHKEEWESDLADFRQLQDETIPNKLVALRKALYELISDPTYPLTRKTN